MMFIEQAPEGRESARASCGRARGGAREKESGSMMMVTFDEDDDHDEHESD